MSNIDRVEAPLISIEINPSDAYLHCDHIIKNFKEHAKGISEVIKIEDCREFLQTLSKEHILVTIKAGEVVIGLIGGFVTPSFFNKDKKIASETFWWIEPEYRDQGYGEELITLFEREAVHHGADLVSMCTIGETADNILEMLLSAGYHPYEQAFIKKAKK